MTLKNTEVSTEYWMPFDYRLGITGMLGEPDGFSAVVCLRTMSVPEWRTDKERLFPATGPRWENELWPGDYFFCPSGSSLCACLGLI